MFIEMNKNYASLLHQVCRFLGATAGVAAAEISTDDIFHRNTPFLSIGFGI